MTKVLRCLLDTSKRVSVLTFNHDLLVEDSLASLPRAYEGAWCLEHTYGGEGWTSDQTVSVPSGLALSCRVPGVPASTSPSTRCADH